MRFPLRTWLLLAGATLSFSAVAGDSLAEQVTVFAKFQDQRLRVIGSTGLGAPHYLAGYYIEWANEQEFVKHERLVEGATYRVTGSVVRANVSRFPEGWGVRSGRPYTSYYVQAESATKAENKK